MQEAICYYYLFGNDMYLWWFDQKEENTLLFYSLIIIFPIFFPFSFKLRLISLDEESHTKESNYSGIIYHVIITP